MKTIVNGVTYCDEDHTVHSHDLCVVCCDRKKAMDRLAVLAEEQRMRVLDYGIGDAIRAMCTGARVSRRGWNGPNQWIALQVPDEHSKMRKPYLYISPVDGELVPWLASQTDILANDWYVVR